MTRLPLIFAVILALTFILPQYSAPVDAQTNRSVNAAEVGYDASEADLSWPQCMPDRP